MKENYKIKIKGNNVLAVVDGKNVGKLIYRYPDDKSGKRNIEIESIWVSPKYRRQGIATIMLKAFLEKFINVVWISFWTGREAEVDKSFKLYEKFRFKESAYQSDYYEKGVGTRLYVKRVKK